jgi:hypothetical protein
MTFDHWISLAQTVLLFIQLGVVVGALIYTRRQIVHVKNQWDEASKSRKLQAARELLNEIGNDEVREARWWALHEMPPIENFQEADSKRARRLIVAMARVGYMVKQELIPEDALFEWQQDEIEILWNKLGTYVQDIRLREKRPHYGINFEWLATEWLPHMEATRRTIHD